MMMKPMVLFAVLLLCGGGAMAQVPASAPTSVALQSCLVGTGATEWNRLKLTRDQLERVRRVQQACKEECDLPGVKKVDNPISNADGSTVMSELENILTKEQYRAWVVYCTAPTEGGDTPK